MDFDEIHTKKQYTSDLGQFGDKAPLKTTGQKQTRTRKVANKQQN